MKGAKEKIANKVVDDIKAFDGIHPPSLEELAYHEAGHAVVALHLKIPIVEVTISPNMVEKRHGRLELEGGGRNGVKPAQELEERLVLEVSGPLAAGILAEERGGFSLLNINELNNALVICEELQRIQPELVAQDAMAWIMKRSKSILDQHWAEVRTIADALLKDKTLSKQRVLELLEVEVMGEDMRKTSSQHGQ